MAEIETVHQMSDEDDVTEAPTEKKKRTKKDTHAQNGDAGNDAENEGGDAPKAKKSKAKPKEAIPDLSALDFSSTATNKDGKPWNMKIASWNVNGLRACVEKNGLSYLTAEQPDILCVQEIKCDKESIPEQCNIDGYHAYWCPAEEKGYSGVGIYSKTEPTNITYGMDIEKHDKEGRVITAEYDEFYLVTSYVPNSGRGLPRLPYRTEEWDVDFRAYLKNLDTKKPVILCGDLNVAHQAIDLKNPKTNKKTAGFTPQERECFTKLLDEGFVDSFRHLHPDTEGAYTFWTYMGNARTKNVGWRLDYFVMSERFTDRLCENLIRKDVMGSDHCPITLLLAM